MNEFTERTYWSRIVSERIVHIFSDSTTKSHEEGKTKVNLKPKGKQEKTVSRANKGQQPTGQEGTKTPEYVKAQFENWFGLKGKPMD